MSEHEDRRTAAYMAYQSDKERLWQAAVAAMQGLLADPHYQKSGKPCADAAFNYADAMVAEFNRRTEGVE